jgi:hypothetical protein
LSAVAVEVRRKPATQLTPVELQHEADAVALRIALGKSTANDSSVVIELANRLVRAKPQELAS